MRVLYLPLERYRERYTEMLTEWSIDGFRACGVTLIPVCDFPLGSIEVGRVLDGVGRGIAATNTVSLALRMLSKENYDAILVEDLFTPGIEALFYARALGGIPKIPIWARNYAQSVDPHDFTYPMRSWMRHYEEMCQDQLHGVFVAAHAHKEMLASANMAERVHVVGLPFDEGWVQRCAGRTEPWEQRSFRVVYASRFDDEKNPLFMLEVARQLRERMPLAQVVVCSGATSVRASGDVKARIEAAAAVGTIILRLGLSKQTYYEELKAARVLLNTATQDFISFTALEASALGVATVAPCLRSFPEFLPASQLYVPFDFRDALMKLWVALEMKPSGVDRAAKHHTLTFSRMAEQMGR